MAMAPVPTALQAYIPSPSINGFYSGRWHPLLRLMYLIGIAMAISSSGAAGGPWAARDLVDEIALWCVPAGISAAGSTSTHHAAEIPPCWWRVRGLGRWPGHLGRGRPRRRGRHLAAAADR